MTIRIALVGFGKIARDEHLPAIHANPDFELVAIVTSSVPTDMNPPHFRTVADMFAAMSGEIDAVAICTPPAPRFAIACEVAAAGVALLLEKPPTATLGELDILLHHTETHEAPVFTAWHSQYAAAIDAAQHTLAGEEIAPETVLLNGMWCFHQLAAQPRRVQSTSVQVEALLARSSRLALLRQSGRHAPLG